MVLLPLSRPLLRALCLSVAAVGLAACRVEIGKDPHPTPTPSPTPTPTPTSASFSTFSEADPAALSADVSPSARVAMASAEYFEDASTDAAEAVTSVRRALSRAQEVPAESAAQVREAKKSLSAAADAYRKAETSVFVVDPESTPELLAQPDPLRAGTPGGRDETLAQLSSSLEKMDGLLARPLNQESAALLLVEADGVKDKIGQLETGLRALADAWKAGEAENFRQNHFLSSSEGAVARVFQGLLAMTGDVLPGMLAGTDGYAGEIVPRLTAVKDLYLGTGEATAEGPSLHSLVQQSSPVQAALTRASLARTVALAGVLEISPGNEPLRQNLVSSLEDATRQLTFAAQSIGILIVAEE